MKTDLYGMFFFALNARPPLCIRPCPFFFFFGRGCGFEFGANIHLSCYWGYLPSLYQFQLICYYSWKWQCTSLFSITCYNSWWSVSRRVYIAQKKWKEGGKQYVPFKKLFTEKSSFHTCDWDPSTYHEYDIHKLLTFTILQYIYNLQTSSEVCVPHDAILQILDRSALQLYKKKTIFKSQGILMQVLI